MEEHPLYAMMELAAIAARAAVPGPVVPVPAPGNPVDDAVAVLAAQMNRESAEMSRVLACEAKSLEDMILDGPPPDQRKT
jgi:hypothetical protein